jgi:hypothetical protein
MAVNVTTEVTFGCDACPAGSVERIPGIAPGARYYLPEGWFQYDERLFCPEHLFRWDDQSGGFRPVKQAAPEVCPAAEDLCDPPCPLCLCVRRDA